MGASASRHCALCFTRARSFPRADCVLLPVKHTSAEELAVYIVRRARAAALARCG